MTFTELIPSLQQLSYPDKLKAIQFLASQLAENTPSSSLLEEGKTYEIWSPYDAFSAERTLTQLLDEHTQSLSQTTK
jgi:hypothetical protein